MDPRTDPLWGNTKLLLRMDGSNNSTTFTDSSAAGHAMTAVGDAKISTARSKFGGASALFDGAGDGVVAADSSDFTIGTGDFTWECWALFSGSSYRTLISAWVNLTFYCDPSGNLALYNKAAESGFMSVPITQNEWHHCAVGRKDGMLYLHIDGRQVASAAYSGNVTNTNMRVGLNDDSSAPMAGNIDEVRITIGACRYEQDFTPPVYRFPTDVAAAPEAPTYDPYLDKVALSLLGEGRHDSRGMVDLSLRPKVPTLFGNPRLRVQQGKFVSSSIYFNNSEVLLYDADIDLHLDGDFTIELWVYRLGTEGYLVNAGGGSGIAWASYLVCLISGSAYFAGSSVNSGYDIGAEGGSGGLIGSVPLETWTHIAVTCEGNVYRGFVNGVLGFTQTTTAHPFNPFPRGIAIGGNWATRWGKGTPSNLLSAYINDFRITNGKARYVAAFTPPTMRSPRFMAKISGNTKDSTDTNAAVRVVALREASGQVSHETLSDAVTGDFEVATQYVDEHTLVYYPAAGDPDLPLQAKVYNSVVPVP